MPLDKLKAQREAFDFLREHFREDEPFPQADLQHQTHWSQKSISTYWSKQFEPFVQARPAASEREGEEESTVSRDRRFSNGRHVAEVSASSKPEASSYV
jgi:hypothetical protein